MALFEYAPRLHIGNSVFTRARIDEKIFGEHTGIQLHGPIITAPWPHDAAHFRTSQKSNPYYMAPGWASHRRHIDKKFYAGTPRMVPKLFVNPWDLHYGLIGSGSTPQNLEVIRAMQMGSQSFV